MIRSHQISNAIDQLKEAVRLIGIRCATVVITDQIEPVISLLISEIEQRARDDRGADRFPGMLTKEVDSQMIFAPVVSRRDMFAMAAMPECQRSQCGSMEDDCSNAVRYADLLIAELDKGKA